MKKTEKSTTADLLPGILTMILLPLVAKGQKTEVDLGKYSSMISLCTGKASFF